MKTKVFLFAAFICMAGNSIKVNAQDAQFVSKEINYILYDDASYKSFISESGFFDFNATILWDYYGKTIKIYDMSTSQIWLQTTYKTEWNPDKIKGDESFRFDFDPAKNDLKIKTIKIYNGDDGNYVYKIEADKQKIEIKGIEPDMDYDGTGDYTQEANKTTVNNNYSQGGQNIRYLYFTNKTNYTIKVVSKTLPNAYGEWVGSTEFISIAPGKKVKIGESAEEFFYYYASCIDANSNVVKWDGSDATLEVPGFSTYNLRKINLSVGTQDDQNNWNVDLTIN